MTEIAARQKLDEVRLALASAQDALAIYLDRELRAEGI